MSDKLYIGIDSGTQGTKTVVLSENSRSVIAESYRTYSLYENERGGKEQHPSLWKTACFETLQEVLSAEKVTPSLVKAIGVSGQQHGLVALDKNGEVIRPAKLWCDTETVDQCNTITQKMGGAEHTFKEIGNQVAAGFTASKILWLKEKEPENYAKLDCALLPHDYINFWLTGEKSTEFGDASGTAYFDITNRTWSEKLLKAIDESGKLSSCLPELRNSDEPCGVIRRELADKLGLSRNTTVSSGGGDNMMAAIGTGNVQEGIVTASLGTSGTIYAYSNKPVSDPQGELAAFCSSSGGWLPLVCTMNVTVATELFRNLFNLGLEEMNRQASKVLPGADGLLLLPYFNGERTPPLPSATGTLSGMTPMNTSQGHICRAAMEGATLGLRYGLDVLRKSGIQPEEIRLVGGGSKSPLWRQLAADIFNCEIVCLAEDEAGATGAALQAMWCSENLQKKSLTIEEITSNFVKLNDDQRHIPEKNNVAAYKEVYDNYLKLNTTLAPLYQSSQSKNSSC